MAAIPEGYFKGLAQEVLSKIGRLNHFTKHGPSIGAFHEQVLKNVIKNLLPNRFSVKTGIVYASPESYSNQIDIMIIDENVPSAYLFKEGDFCVVQPDAVICTIEVKTKLDAEKFQNAIENCYSVIKTGQMIDRIIHTFVFAYQTNNNFKEALSGWYQEADIPDDHKSYPDGIYCFGQGVLQFVPYRERNTWGHYLKKEQGKEINSSVLSMFLSEIKEVSEMKTNTRKFPFPYATPSDLLIEDGLYKYGKGFVPLSN